MQQVIGGDVDKSVQLLIALQPRQQVDIVAPQFPQEASNGLPTSCSPASLNNPGACSVSRNRGSARLAVMAPLARQQLRQERRILNVSPVVAAGVGKQYVDIDMLTQRLQRLKIDRRQRGNPADEDARRQPGGRFVRFFQVLIKRW